jgi:NAD(P)-dependent dehydrogenase (short-subunit alcohol dehydrogenase family)
MTSRIALITGASSGMGWQTALALAKMNYTIIITCRNTNKANDTKNNLLQLVPNATLHAYWSDLSDIKATAAMCNQIVADFPIIDVLINNAGLYISEYQKSKDGIELTFANNHLSYINVTKHIMPSLLQSKAARIINVASEANKYARLEGENWMLEGKTYSAIRFYAHSKLYNIMYTLALAKELMGTKITANCLHPGGVNTNFAKGGSGFIGLVFTYLGKLLRSPEKGAETIIWLATSIEVEGKTGGYYYDKKIIRAQAAAYDQHKIEQLRIYSEALIQKALN